MKLWVHVTVKAVRDGSLYQLYGTGVLLIVSTGFAPGSIYGSSLFVHGYFDVCGSSKLDPVRSFWYEAFFEISWRSKGLHRERLSSQVVMPQEGR
jgi:hypothetical protein